MEALNPLVLWAQRRDKVIVSINICDIHDEKFSVDESNITFSGISGTGVRYSCNLALYGDVIPQESKHKKTGRELLFSLKRKEPGPYWPRLLKEPKKVAFIRVDFNRWKDESESDEDEDQFEDGLENLMHKMDMGGAGNNKFDPGELDGDSDDEDIPDLES